eukprot:GHVT01043631.1.p1 GENE.GHVT01043631.1~~GHVT01043631.1.p1  ORF type:complete len:108 (-),score=15.55 GHVT01043631.1:1226-1549(-)
MHCLPPPSEGLKRRQNYDGAKPREEKHQGEQSQRPEGASVRPPHGCRGCADHELELASDAFRTEHAGLSTRLNLSIVAGAILLRGMELVGVQPPTAVPLAFASQSLL